jgi:hypothetical protein
VIIDMFVQQVLWQGVKNKIFTEPSRGKLIAMLELCV